MPYRHGDSFYICLGLPGIDPGSIDLTVEQSVLTVRADRGPTQADGPQMIVAERPYGTFTRQVFLGETLDAEDIAANYAAACSPDHPGARGGQAPQHPGHQQRRQAGRQRLTRQAVTTPTTARRARAAVRRRAPAAAGVKAAAGVRRRRRPPAAC
jgi:hypothetical protein